MLYEVITSDSRSLFPYPTDPIEDDVFYFVMPDRFADGNAANNRGVV